MRRPTPGRSNEPAADRVGRPLLAYGESIHDCCERAHFDAGQYVEAWGDEGHRTGYCLFEKRASRPLSRRPRQGECHDIRGVDLVTRIEGHLRIAAEVDGVKCKSTMFRGIELIHRYYLEEGRSSFGPQKTEAVNVRT